MKFNTTPNSNRQMPDFAVARAKTNEYISRIGREIILLLLKIQTFACFIHTHLEKIHFKCTLQITDAIQETFQNSLEHCHPLSTCKYNLQTIVIITNSSHGVKIKYHVFVCVITDLLTRAITLSDKILKLQAKFYL